MNVNKNCMSYWFPPLLATGVPVPETYIVGAPDLFCLLDGKIPEGWGTFVGAVGEAAGKVDFPCFLRTGLMSAKHDWQDTCFIRGADELETHISMIVDLSGCADQPTDVWAVRRYVPLVSTFTAFRGLPINRERRYFACDGEITCRHAYWPEFAVGESRNLPADWRSKLAALNAETPGEVATLSEYARVVSLAPGLAGQAWSIDFAQAQTGQWLCIDMATMERSYHDPDCPHSSEEMRRVYGKEAREARSAREREQELITDAEL